MGMQVVLSVGAAIVAFTSITFGARYNLENSTKLYALTFMLVSLSALPHSSMLSLVQKVCRYAWLRIHIHGHPPMSNLIMRLPSPYPPSLR